VDAKAGKIIFDNFKKQPLIFVELLFLSLIVISIYFIPAVPFLRPVLLTIIIITLISSSLRLKKDKKIVLLGALLLSLLLIEKHGLIIVFWSTIYYRYFILNPSKRVSFLYHLSVITPILILILESIHVSIKPINSLFIWYWGIGYPIFSGILYFALKEKTIPILSILCIIVSLISLNKLNSNITVGLQKDLIDNLSCSDKYFEITGFNTETLNTTNSAKILDCNYILAFPFLNSNFDEKWAKNIKGPQKIILFGEHDNLNNFITKNPAFKNDSYIRKKPWEVYDPIFQKRLAFARLFDPLYCSNIGCTIKNDFHNFPIIWDYTKSGQPIILASGKGELNKKEIIFFGDSDPVVPFLLSYNCNLIKALLSDTNLYFDSIWVIGLLLFISLFYIDRYKYKILLLISIFAVVLWVQYLAGKGIGKSDVNVFIDSNIYNPHYEFNVSSIPLKISKNNFSICLNEKCKTKNEIHVISKKIKFERKKLKRIVYLMPGTKIIFEDKEIKAGKIPQGRTVFKIKERRFNIENAYFLFINNKPEFSPIIKFDNMIFLATGSPEKNIENLLILLD